VVIKTGETTGRELEGRKKIDPAMMLAGLNKSEGKGFTDFAAADPATYNGVTFNEMQRSDDPAFRNITKGQMRAMGGVIYFAPEFKGKNGREINLHDSKDLAAYNEWSAKKASKFGVEPLSAQTVATLSEENINRFFTKNYFDKAGISAIKDSGVQYVLFDISVNFGVGSEQKNNGMMGILEKTMQHHFPKAQGADIFEKANNVAPEELIKKIGVERIKAYDRIIVSNPAKEQFRNGWKNRTERVTKEALSGEIGGGAVASYSRHNKTYGVSGVADEEFFNTDAGFWETVMNVIKGIVKAIFGNGSEYKQAGNVPNGSTPPSQSTLPTKSASAGKNTSTPAV
jgi:hypothetical protein